MACRLNYTFTSFPLVVCLLIFAPAGHPSTASVAFGRSGSSLISELCDGIGKADFGILTSSIGLMPWDSGVVGLDATCPCPTHWLR